MKIFDMSDDLVTRIRDFDGMSGIVAKNLIEEIQRNEPFKRLSFAEMDSEDRAEWVGRFADFVIDGEKHTMPVRLFESNVVYPVKRINGIPGFYNHLVFPREDLPRAFNVDGSPVDVGELAPGSIIDDHSQLEDVPVGTVIVDTECDVMKKAENGTWVTDCGSTYPAYFLTMPVVVLPRNVDFGL